MQTALLGMTNAAFDVIGQRLIRFYISVRYWRKGREYNGTVHQPFIDFKKAYDSLGGKYYARFSLSSEYPGNWWG
jgi:hypothetical protein